MYACKGQHLFCFQFNPIKYCMRRSIGDAAAAVGLSIKINTEATAGREKYREG